MAALREIEMAIIGALDGRNPDAVFDELLSNQEELRRVARRVAEELRSRYGDLVVSTLKMMAQVVGYSDGKERIYLILYNGYRNHPVLGRYVSHPRFREFVDKMVDLVLEFL